MPDLGVRRGEQPRTASSAVPVRPEHVRPEVPDDRVLVGGRQQVDDRQPVADGLPRRRLEHRPHLPLRPAGPAVAGPVEVPGAVHPEVRVQRQPARQPGQQVLAARHDLEHRLPGQVDRRQRRHPEVAAHQHVPGQRLVQPLARRARRCRPQARRASAGRVPRPPRHPLGPRAERLLVDAAPQPRPGRPLLQRRERPRLAATGTTRSPARTAPGRCRGTPPASRSAGTAARPARRPSASCRAGCRRS